MLVDGGWYAGTGDPATDDIRKPIPEIDIPAILAQAKSRNVRSFCGSNGARWTAC